MDFPLPQRARFGVFELDLKAGELHKGGQVVLLQEQPLQILLMLVEHRGEVVTRDEIRRKLWPNDTIVEFDHAINTAVKKLRQALSDSAQRPSYVETVGRRGYRLMMLVEWIGVIPNEQEDSSSQDAAPAKSESAPAVMTGKRVSHYRVLEILGGGGMGVVYKAEDIKLGRPVALKFLPEELGTDAKTLERFEREARSASAVEHPNICPIYEFGEHEGQPFIVMQLLEGQTLRERIEAGGGARPPFETGQLLDIAIQVTEGLDSAHQKGIVHRDIKPANIFITKRSEVKILDFGLAKLTSLASDMELDRMNSPGHKAPAGDLGLTRTGVALGTAAYMSPEQVRGDQLDGRTDLFSFGLVLYEMATGRRAFSGQTTAILHSAILNGTPIQARQLNPEVPARLEEIINKAVEKDREMRHQSAAELRAELQYVAAGLRSETDSASLQLALLRRPSVLLPAAVLVLVLLVSAAVWFTKRVPSPPSGLLELTQRQLTENSSENAVGSGAISPDGNYLAYSDARGLHRKVIETGETQAIPPPPDFNGVQVNWGIVPAWADGGTRLIANAMISGQRPSVWTVPVMGGAPLKVRDDAFAYSVSRDGSRVAFGTKPNKITWSELWVMTPDGKQAQKLYDADPYSGFGGAEWSPDGRRVAYTRPRVVANKYKNSIESRPLAGGRPTTIVPSADNRLQDWCWSPDGRMIYSLSELEPNETSCNLWATRVDARTGEPRGQPQRLTNWAGFCMDNPSATADGKRLTFRKWSRQGNVYVADLQANGKRLTAPTRLTLSEGASYPRAWTADSKAVIFGSKRNGKGSIFKQALNEDTAQPIVTGSGDAYEPRLSPDGAWILYVTPLKNGGFFAPLQLMRVPIVGGTPQVVLTADFSGHRCARSPAALCAICELTPDRKQLVFTAFHPLEGRGRELSRFDAAPGAAYSWDLSPDGAQIALLKQSTSQIHILSLSGQRPREITVKSWNSIQSVDWAADGKRLFVSTSIPQGAALLQVDLQGSARVLWEQRGSTAPLTDFFENLGGPSVPWAVPSPDGRHLAIYGSSVSANIWMIENF